MEAWGGGRFGVKNIVYMTLGEHFTLCTIQFVKVVAHYQSPFHMLSRPLATRLSNWFRKSLSSRKARTTSSVHRRLLRKEARKS